MQRFVVKRCGEKNGFIILYLGQGVVDGNEHFLDVLGQEGMSQYIVDLGIVVG